MAAQMNSQVDQFRMLTVPPIDDVRRGLESYILTKARAGELPAKIERTDDLINGIASKRYRLTDDERVNHR